MDYGNAYSSCDGLQVENPPTQDSSGNIAQIAYDSNREKLKKFRAITEDEEVTNAEERKQETLEKLHWSKAG